MLAPEKLFYKIGEVSEITGLESYVLRFWETEFSSLHPQKNRGNQRLYTKKEIELILQIKKLLYEEGLTIAGAKKRLSQSARRKEPIPAGLSQSNDITSAIHTVRKELEELLHILS